MCFAGFLLAGLVLLGATFCDRSQGLIDDGVVSARAHPAKLSKKTL